MISQNRGLRSTATYIATLAIGFYITLYSTLVQASYCQTGVYTDSNNAFVAITRQDKDYRFLDSMGHYGTLDFTQPQTNCQTDTLKWQGKLWTKQQTDVTNTFFTSGDARLAGQLMLPPQASTSTPLVVYAHGSEAVGWIDSAMEPYQLLARGVSVFVYDKRGTGRSSGQYNQNFPMLAQDLVAAAQEAKRLAKGKFGRFGLIGLSQGGWIAPMASNDAQADFIAIGYGLVASIDEEDADQVQLEISEMGLGERQKTAAKSITDVTARMIKSNYRDGIDELTALKRQFASEPWLNNIRGSYTGVLIATDPKVLLEKGIPFFDSLNVDWNVDPIHNIQQVKAEQYWALAELDREAPIEKTVSRLLMLKKQGKPIHIRVFPNSDHGMRVVNESRIVSGYFDSQADFAKGNMKPSYADSWIVK